MRTSQRLGSAFLVAALLGCSSAPSASSSSSSDATLDAAVDEAATEAAPLDACSILFGRPNDKTGLGADQCAPQCACAGDAFVPPTYDAAFIQSLVSDWSQMTPSAAIASDPYAVDAAPPSDPADTVCAVLPGPATTKPRAYDLVTYPSTAAAIAAGAKVTHYGRCGVCSSLANLAVYMKNDDLTAPVRDCGTQLSSDGGTQFDADVACLEKLGFDLPCAQIWAYNTKHTRDQCLSTCLPLLSAPYNNADGTINACLQCDEDKSGPVFKSVAGRTRRNSGVPNAICRPCSEVRPLVHAY